jgi:hypothetical protein
MSAAAPSDPAGRDRSVIAVRIASSATGIGAAALAAALSVTAAHAFKGHDGKAAAAPRADRVVSHVSVPGPQHVPAITGAPAPLLPPPSPPAALPPEQPVPAETSGGS